MVSCSASNILTSSILLAFALTPGMLLAQVNTSTPNEAHEEIVDPMKLVEEDGVAFSETKRIFQKEKFNGLKKRYSQLEGIVMVGITNNNGEVLLRGPEDWAPPGGAVQQGESWIPSARNIIEKQTGLSVEIEEAVLVEKMNFYKKGDQDTHFSGLILHLRASLKNQNTNVKNPDFSWFSEVPEDAHPNHLYHIRLYLED